jgi:hypothetical protein
VRWVTPLLFTGTEADAEAFQRRDMDFTFASTSEGAILLMSADRGAIVPSREVAGQVVRHFGGSDEWIASHVLADW